MKHEMGMKTSESYVRICYNNYFGMFLPLIYWIHEGSPLSYGGKSMLAYAKKSTIYIFTLFVMNSEKWI